MFKKFLFGDISLFKTFWLITVPCYLILGVIATIIKLESGSITAKIWVLFFLLTMTLTSIARWNSSSKFDGLKLWKWLVKIGCVFDFWLIVSIISIGVYDLLGKH